MLPVEYLAKVGLAHLHTHHRGNQLAALRTPAQATPNSDGCQWFQRITWPDRVPGLKTWAGQQSLHRLINDRVKFLGGTDSLSEVAGLQGSLLGVSGLDSWSCKTAIDVGFAPNALDMPVVQRVGLELLAIVGLEAVPLVSWERRLCGFLDAGRIWQFEVLPRDEGSYYSVWGDLREIP